MATVGSLEAGDLILVAASPDQHTEIAKFKASAHGRSDRAYLSLAWFTELQHAIDRFRVDRAESSFKDTSRQAFASLYDAAARHPSPASISEGWWTRF